MVADCEREGRRAGEHPPIRCGHLQPRRSLGRRGKRTATCLTIRPGESRTGALWSPGHSIFGREPSRSARFRGGRAGKAEFRNHQNGHAECCASAPQDMKTWEFSRQNGHAECCASAPQDMKTWEFSRQIRGAERRRPEPGARSTREPGLSGQISDEPRGLSGRLGVARRPDNADAAARQAGYSRQNG